MLGLGSRSADPIQVQPSASAGGGASLLCSPPSSLDFTAWFDPLNDGSHTILQYWSAAATSLR